jgi:hypothetical protein
VARRAQALTVGLGYPLSMRAVIAALVAGAALLVVPLASASFFPPAGQLRLENLQTLKLTPFKWDTRTCSAQSNAQSALAKVSRKVHPVACEQPPRSNVLNGAFVITFAH